jgi:hypothetical protein
MLAAFNNQNLAVIVPFLHAGTDSKLGDGEKSQHLREKKHAPLEHI